MTRNALVFLILCLGLSPRHVGADTLEQQRALFLQAEQALDQGRLDEARQLAGSLAGYPLQPHLLFEILSKAPATDPEIPAFFERYGQTRPAGALRRKWLEKLAELESWPHYVRYYRETDNTEARCNYFFALHRLERNPEAYAGAAKLWAAAEPASAACQRLFAVWTASPEFTTEAVWKRLGAALAKGRTALATALPDLLPAEQRPTAALWLKVHEDPALVEQCTPWRPDNPVHGLIFAHGIDRLAARDPRRAQLVWNLRRSGFSIPREVQARIDRRLALALAAEHHPQAAAYLGAIPDDGADNPTRTWRVRSALLKQDWPGALAALERLDEAEKKQTAWRYWRARAMDALGDSAGAAEIFQALAGKRDFFGFIAADRARRDYAFSFTDIPVAESELSRLATSEPFQAVAEFRTLNRPGEAQKEWVHAVESLSPPDRTGAAKLAQQWGWHRLAILALTKADRPDDLSLRFPLAYSEPVLRESRAQGIDPAVIYGVIRRESAFDPEAKSPAGAFGLMQLLPGTGEQVARILGENWRTTRSLLDPGLNVRYGTAYFRRLMDRFNHHFALAAAAYNAGPTRVARWLPSASPIPADVWIETLPFRETREYLGAVLSYAVIYRERLGAPRVRISEFLPAIEPARATETEPDLPTSVPSCQQAER